MQQNRGAGIDTTTKDGLESAGQDRARRAATG